MTRGSRRTFRCAETADGAARCLEIPEWMFDRVACCGSASSLVAGRRRRCDVWTAIVLPYNPICFDRSLRHWNGANCLRMFGETGRDHDVPRYACRRGWLDSGEPRCIAFGGLRVDDAIEEELLRVLEPGALEPAGAAVAAA